MIGVISVPVNHVANIKQMAVKMPGVVNVLKQNLVGPDEGWEGWVMRLFTLGPGGCTPRHTHAWPHINYMVGGRGTLLIDGVEHEVRAGSVAYVGGEAEHQFKNTGDEDFIFICIVPEEGDK